jgi:hypothetical protein
VDRKRFWLLAVGIICVVLVVPFIIFALAFRATFPRLPVNQEALLRAQEVIATLQQPQSSNRLNEAPDYLANCHDFLRKKLLAHRSQYSLVVTGAFDPDDPNIRPAGIYSFNGSRDASVVVQFPDGSEAELYFYAGAYESCRILNP